MIIIFFTLFYVILLISIVAITRKFGKRNKPDYTVVPFRTYHRIEYLRKKRLDKQFKKGNNKWVSQRG